MKRTIILTLLVLIINFAHAQHEFSIINVYRPKMMMGSLILDHIFIDGIKICELKDGGFLSYKVFNTRRNCTISVNYSLSKNPAKLAGNNQSLSFNLENGKTYYFILDQKTSGPTISQIFAPVQNKVLNESNFITLSDIGSEDYKILSNHPTTNWTKANLIKYWEKLGISDIEGIYEKVGNAFEYELAVVKDNNEYSIIYLSGADGTSWKTGDLKATLQKTAAFGLFKAKWYMLNKTQNKDVIVTFQQSTMSTLSETSDVNDDVYIKIYPTYDNERAISGNSGNWKSSGTAFFISKDGYLATNYHVIDNANEIEIEYLGNSYFAKIALVDKQNDLAILKIVDDKFLLLRDLIYYFKTDLSDVGTSVFSLGYPLTMLMGNEIKFTDGKISSKTGFQGQISNYQISVPIQPGNSGGPLFDFDGNLVGITSSGINRELDLTENVNYAIKTKYLALLIDELDEKIELPKSLILNSKPLTEKIKILSDIVVLIKVK